MAKSTIYKTGGEIAKAMGISGAAFSQHAKTFSWGKPPWTAAQVADAIDQLEALRAVAPNDSRAAGDNIAALTARAKIKLLSERIKALEADNAERSGKLVPKELVAEGRMAIIKQFKGAWDYLESRAYELVGLEEAAIAKRIGGWRDEFYEAIHHGKNETGTIGNKKSDA